MHDVGKALAVLASQRADTVPPEVHLSGDSKSMLEIAEIMEANGAGKVEVIHVPLEGYKAGVIARPSPTPERYLRFLMGEGKIDHSAERMDDQNYLLQAAGTGLTWTSVSQLAKETKGRPWADTEWQLVD